MDLDELAGILEDDPTLVTELSRSFGLAGRRRPRAGADHHHG
jgi:hypothetical protein